MVVGGSVLAMSWVIGLADAQPFENQGGWMFVPVVGPWITLGWRNPHPHSNSDSVHEPLLSVPTRLVLEGIGQGFGAALIGLAYSPRFTTPDASRASIHFAPAVSDSSVAVAVFGQF